MVLVALLSFAAIVVAWLFAPDGARQAAPTSVPSPITTAHTAPASI